MPHSEGTIEIDGEDAARLAAAAIARRLAYLPQGSVLHWPLSVERLVGLGRLPHFRPFSRIGSEDREATDARTLGPRLVSLSSSATDQIARSESPTGALALLLVSPEFLRR